MINTIISIFWTIPTAIVFYILLTVILGVAQLYCYLFSSQRGMIDVSFFIFSRACQLIMRVSFLAKLRLEDRRRRPHREYALYISNHQSIMDVPLNALLVKANAIMKKEVLRIPFFGLQCYIGGNIPLDRKNRNARKEVGLKAEERLLAGMPLQIYPEGTRSKDGVPKPLNELHPRLLEFCYSHQIPVTPSSMNGTRDLITSRGLNIRQKLSLIVHETIYPANYKTKDDFIAAAWTTVVNGVKEIKSND